MGKINCRNNVGNIIILGADICAGSNSIEIENHSNYQYLTIWNHQPLNGILITLRKVDTEESIPFNTKLKGNPSSGGKITQIEVAVGEKYIRCQIQYYDDPHNYYAILDIKQ